MHFIKKITAVMLSTAMLTGAAFAAAVQTDEDIFVTSASAASTSSAPKLNKGILSLGKGESFKLTAAQSVKWRTSDSKLVTVDGRGNVKAVGTGTAWVTAKNNSGLESSCRITVKNAPQKVTISKGVLTLGVGETYTLSAAVPDGSAAAKRTFRTNNSSVVRMTNTNWTGSFKAMKAGTAYVTVRTYNGKEASCKVTVKAAESKPGNNNENTVIKFKKPDNWGDEVMAYVWASDKDGIKNANWPGVAMTDNGDGIYTYIVDKRIMNYGNVKVVFSQKDYVKNQMPKWSGFPVKNGQLYDEVYLREFNKTANS